MFSTYVLIQGLPLNLEVTALARLTGQEAPGISQSLLPCVGARDLDSDPHACSRSTSQIQIGVLESSLDVVQASRRELPKA